MNKVVLVGRLTKDVELRFIAGTGTPVANFSLAIDREFTGKNGKKETDFIDVQAWGKSAENCANYIGKGAMVAVDGSIRVDKYQAQDGSKRTSFRINADRVQFLDSKKKEVAPQTETFKPTFEQLDGEEMFNEVNFDDCPF
ncbi:single-stranded DNA-binding protein [Romboutsia sp.]|uniref:single-stranded DNA-binding protein n=1 Tax=Romboutsia sp. TaxID=1965302 RepID=UPI002C0EEBE8|nr:single-stranded DNA-binding protein [Romboutsia sp.]HSQ90206.1 single-stranded DNA-binding protein [Romboutsia sp.]